MIPAIRRARPGRVLAVVLSLWGGLLTAVGVGCGFEADTRRPAATDFAAIEHAAVSRPSLVLAPAEGPVFESVVHGVGSGSFVTHVARRGAGSAAHVRITLSDTGFARWLREPLGACELHWTAQTPPGWSRCAIPIHGDYGRLRLAVHHTGDADSEILLSAPIFEARAARKKRPPVFVIVLDTARADGFKSFESRSPIGAELATLERDGIVFTNARSPSGWTRPAVATLLTGRSPFTHQVLGRFDALGSGSVTLAQVLRDGGYVTRAWSTNPNVLERWGFAQGFDAFEDVGSRAWGIAKPDGRRVIEQVEMALDRDGAAGRLFYIHLMDPHQPYQPDDQSLAQLDRLTRSRYTLPGRAAKPARTNALRARYREYQAELLETDQHMGALLASLRRRGAYDSALILVVSDHGEEFLDHMGSGHGKTLYEEMLRIPVWLKLPEGRRAGERVEDAVDLADLFPTLLSALGLPIPASSEGRDLLASTRAPRPQLSRLRLEGRDLAAVVDGDWKLVLDLGADRAQLFDLEADPKEREDRIAAHPERARHLRTLLEARLLEHERGWHVRACGGVGPAELAFSIQGQADIRVQARHLESEDRIEIEGGTTRLELSLPPRSLQQDRVFGDARETAADEDELLVSATGETAEEPITFELRSEAETIALRVGSTPALAQAARIRSDDLLERARVSPGYAVQCRREESPYLHVWFVEAPQRDDRAIDPALSERLKALGYAE